jgi:hypothetical protein
VVDITEISAMVAAAGVLIGVVYYILDMRNQTKMRHTDLAMRISSWWTTEETFRQWLRTMDLEFKDFEDFTKKYGNVLSEKPEQIAVIITMDHFDAVGYLLHRKMIDYGLVRLMPVVATWEKVKPLVEGLRRQQSGQYRRPYMIWFEYLNNEVKKREQKFQQSKV